MVLQMENTRRSFDRSREPGAKKPRLAGEPVRGVNPNGRPFPQRPAAQVTNTVAQRLRNVDRDSDSNGGYEPQSLQQRNEELVNQYKTALAELTFNSKPIITNLTIIAGENLHAAKAIAATICSNILEAPSEQKLPSLYLLDSIVKNIARDYIKYVGARLPVVFCKAFRQVEPPVCQSMRHLFGTWKGVFPLQPLQIIEKELGFASVNGSSGGAAMSKPESQSPRTSHSIHVNPKYLERQRLEQSGRAKEMTIDTGAISNSMEDIAKPSRTASFSVGRPWADTPLKPHIIQRRDALSEHAHEKNVTAAYEDYEYGSDPPRNSGFGIGRTTGRVTDHGLEKPWGEASNAATETITSQSNSFNGKHGFPKYPVLKPADPRSRLLSTQNAAGRVGGGMSSNWKNSEEEEFMWDDMNSKLTDHGVANTSNDTRKDRLTPDEPERLGIKNQLQKPQNIHGMGSRSNREIAADSLSSEQKEQPIFGRRMSSSLSVHESHLMDERLLSHTAPVSSGNAKGFRPSFGGLPTNDGSSIARTRVRTQLGSAHGGSPAGFMTNAASRTGATMGHEQFRSLGTTSPPEQSPMGQNSPSPSRSNPQNQYIPDILLGSLQKLQPQELQDSSHFGPSHQLRQSYSFSQQLQSDFSSVNPQKPLLPKVLKSSASNHSSSLASEAPGQSITSRLAAVMNSGILSNNLISASIPNSFKDMGQTPSQSGTQPPLSGGISPQFTSSGPQVLSASSIGSMSIDNLPGRKIVSQGKVEQPPLPSSSPPSSLGGSVSPRTSNSANPFSNLLSSLVSKGLISTSKKETPVVVLPSTHLQDESPSISSTSSDLASTDPVSSHVHATDEVALSEPAAIRSALLTQPATIKIESLIGFEFKPEVIRELHPSVISALFDDFPRQCSECGLRLKFEGQLDKHLEWHTLKKHESLGLHRASRKWFANPDNWICGYIGLSDTFESTGSGEEEHAKMKKRAEPMVPADESQYACLLCGELFEDYYCVESDGWMFNGAVYMSIPSGQGTINGKADEGAIVHANCISESSFLDLGMTNAIKMEVDT